MACARRAPVLRPGYRELATVPTLVLIAGVLELRRPLPIPGAAGAPHPALLARETAEVGDEAGRMAVG